MSKIVVVDDDYASQLLVEHLRFNGHEVTLISTVTDALEKIDTIAGSDLLVLDMIMPPPENADPSVYGGVASGMLVFKQVRAANTDMPIFAYSAISDSALIETLSKNPNTTFCARWNFPKLDDLVSQINLALGVDATPPSIKPFIVHGHDDATKLEVKNYLQNRLELQEPIILHEQPNRGRTIIEKFEHYSGEVELVFVLLTPDDRGPAATDNNSEKRRARQNVIFELGYFLGTLGRSSGRVILLYKGELELPSDLSGVIYIDISNGIEAAGEEIRKELAHVLE